jgi:hypothetical protein
MVLRKLGLVNLRVRDGNVWRNESKELQQE